MNQDPSMEEILASIKRVIAEDGRNAAATARPARRPPRVEVPPQPPEQPAEDVLELDVAMAEESTLVSEVAAAASRHSLAALAAMRQVGEPPAAKASEGPLEAVIREMLRPMLKDWLDKHLPDIVEDMVRREIGRITGRPL